LYPKIKRSFGAGPEPSIDFVLGRGQHGECELGTINDLAPIGTYTNYLMAVVSQLPDNGSPAL